MILKIRESAAHPETRSNLTLYLSLIAQTILDVSKILIYEFFNDSMIPKRGKENLQGYYMDNDSLVIQIEGLDVYKDIAIDVEERYDTSSYDEKRKRKTFPGGKIEKL